MKIVLSTLALFSSFALVAQVEEMEPVPPPPPPLERTETIEIQAEIADFPDVDAQFPGGAEMMKKYIQENVMYPQAALEAGDMGVVYVSFIVEQDGSLTDIKVPISLAPSLDTEAIRLVSSMPKWEPGTMNGEPVRSQARLPITFTLGDPSKLRRTKRR